MAPWLRQCGRRSLTVALPHTPHVYHRVLTATNQNTTTTTTNVKAKMTGSLMFIPGLWSEQTSPAQLLFISSCLMMLHVETDGCSDGV